jgi:UDP-glucose 4-epimerase
MILGASGFIGRHLSSHLSSNGWQVDRVVRSSVASDTEVIGEQGGIRTIRLGSSENRIARAVSLSEPDVVFNLAAAGVGKQIPYSELVEGNVGIVAQIMESIDPRRTTMVIHAGSWSQYLNENPAAAIEESDRMDPLTVYGAVKVGAELVGRTIASEIGVGFLTLRLFNIYGPGETPYRLIPYVTNAISAGTPADLTSGDQVRDFVHIDDAVTAFSACAALSDSVPSSFNVATGIPTRVRDVAVMAAQAAGGDSARLRFGAKPSRAGEPMRVVGNASALTEATGWEPKVPIAVGVHNTVQWILESGVNRG